MSSPQISVSVWHLRVCPHGAPYLTRGRVCTVSESQSEVTSRLSVRRKYLHVTCYYVCIWIYNIYIASCQSRLGTGDHVLSFVAPATTAVYSLERSYAWPPPVTIRLYRLSYYSTSLLHRPATYILRWSPKEECHSPHCFVVCVYLERSFKEMDFHETR
jgi:hypothetical protein